MQHGPTLSFKYVTMGWRSVSAVGCIFDAMYLVLSVLLLHNISPANVCKYQLSLYCSSPASLNKCTCTNCWCRMTQHFQISHKQLAVTYLQQSSLLEQIRAHCIYVSTMLFSRIQWLSWFHRIHTPFLHQEIHQNQQNKNKGDTE